MQPPEPTADGVPCLLCRSAAPRVVGRRSDFGFLSAYDPFVGDGARFDRAILRCEVCGFQFSHPAYTQEEILALYDQPGYQRFMRLILRDFQDKDSPTTRRHLQDWQEQYLAMGIREWNPQWRFSPGNSPTLLEVGCGMGWRLAVFRDLGFQTTGIDLSTPEAEFACSHLDLNVRRIALEELPDTAGPFDCIVAAHTLEHLTDPHAFLAQCRRLLAPDGILALEVPMGNEYAQDADKYRDIFHTLFFDHFSLTLLGQLHGFSLRRTHNNSFFNPADGTVNHFITLIFVADQTALEIPSPLLIRSMRQAYDALLPEFLSWSRSGLRRQKPWAAFFAWGRNKLRDTFYGMLGVFPTDVRRKLTSGIRRMLRLSGDR